MLSGYCLTASALRGTRPSDLAQFYVRRELLAIRLSPTEFLRTLAFPGSAGGLLPQGWTLRVEMIFSLLMPGMALLAARTHWAALVAASLALLAISSDQFSALRVSLDFSMGIVVYLERDRITAAFARLPRGAASSFGVAGLLLLTVPIYALLEASRPQLSTVISSAGATLLLVAALHGPWLRRFLAWRPVAALGRVSYSIYLIHIVVLVLLTPLLPRRTGLVGGATFALGVALVSCALAPLSYRFVELPCIRAGNAACAFLARRMGGTLRAARSA